jgi:23S rRNA pseudouridine1911/1915/1917 synthase
MSTLPAATESVLTFIIGEADCGQRLDRWLANQLPERSRSEIQRWIDAGLVKVGEKIGKASYRLELNDSLTVTLPDPPTDLSLQPADLPLSILYEDEDLLVIDKPAGLVVHPAPGHNEGTLVNAVLHHSPDLIGVGGERRPGIVHRLDKETSGVIVVAKTDQAHRHLQAQFKARTVHKEYIALVDGQITPPQGRINVPIGRHPTDRLRQAVLPPDPVTGAPRGRPAVTDYRLIGSYTSQVRDNIGRANFSLLNVVIHTGRTHQIRVHLAWYKHPVVGDTLYGYRRPRLPIERQFLHAHLLRFRLPSSGEEREFIAPLPADLQQVLDQLESV